MDLRNSDIWFAHLLENLPEEKLTSPLKDDNPDWEYIDGEMLKLGSLAHNQLDIPEIQRRGLALLASESKDFRLLAHLLRTLQHAGDPLLALRLLALYVEHYWTVAAPQNAAHKQRFATQVIKRFEAGVENFAENADTTQRESLLAELAKLAQRWQNWRSAGRSKISRHWHWPWMASLRNTAVHFVGRHRCLQRLARLHTQLQFQPHNPPRYHRLLLLW